MAAGARREIEMFSCVDPVSPIRVIRRWFQYVGFAFKRYEASAERAEEVHGKISQRLNKVLHQIQVFFAMQICSKQTKHNVNLNLAEIKGILTYV